MNSEREIAWRGRAGDPLPNPGVSGPGYSEQSQAKGLDPGGQRYIVTWYVTKLLVIGYLRFHPHGATFHGATQHHSKGFIGLRDDKIDRANHPGRTPHHDPR